jgi:hypothetical protein
VICGTKVPVDIECDNCSEGVLIYSSANHLDDVYLIPPIDLTHHDKVIMIRDHMNQSKRETKLILSLFKKKLSQGSQIAVTGKSILTIPQEHM